MPYYNSFQQSYQPYQQSYQQQPMMQSYAPQPMMQNQQSGGIIWVQGEVGARAYPVQPGSSVLLMDSEGQNFFIKSADMSGMPNMKRYSYSEVVGEPMRLESKDFASEHDTADVASREEVKALHEEIADLRNKLATMEVDLRNERSKSTTTGGKSNVK